MTEIDVVGEHDLAAKEQTLVQVRRYLLASQIPATDEVIREPCSHQVVMLTPNSRTERMKEATTHQITFHLGTEEGTQT